VVVGADAVDVLPWMNGELVPRDRYVYEDEVVVCVVVGALAVVPVVYVGCAIGAVATVVVEVVVVGAGGLLTRPVRPRFA
jgi:hypothetical protein